MFYKEYSDSESAWKIIGILNAEEQIMAKQLDTIHWTEIPNFQYIGHISYD